MSRQIYEHDFVQATDLFDSIETDRKNLSEEQVEEIKEVVVVAHGEFSSDLLFRFRIEDFSSCFSLNFPSVLHFRTPNSNPRYQGRMRTVCVQWRFRERIHSRLSGLHSHHERRIPPPFGCYPRRESQRTLHARREDFSGNRKDLGRCGSQIHHGTKGQKEEELLINRIDLPFFVIVPVLQGWIQLILLVV